MKEKYEIHSSIIDGITVARKVLTELHDWIEERNKLQKDFMNLKKQIGANIIRYEKPKDPDELKDRIIALDKKISDYIDTVNYLEIVPVNSGDSYTLQLSIRMN